ncbi:LPP20 family lipoprotein [Helicobacter cynogastricus]|uniref:LPP20 family lipoprotein n=1 Tax=Helicobacter cynogastricus TaxID=329937 RepID=UPI000CF060BB|nr:LPP20 family lipoprotein [Helicobacter cynogastricus]
MLVRSMRLSLIFAPLLLGATPPDWYQNFNGNPAYFYGYGSGENKQIAKEKALNDLASSIVVNVSSTTTSNTTRMNKTLDKRSSQNINLVVDSIKFVNVKVDKQECTHHLCYTRLKLDKNMFLNTLTKRYNNLYNGLSALHPLEGCRGIFLKEMQKLITGINKALPLQELLNAYGLSVASLTPYQNLLKENSPHPKARIVYAPGSDEEIADALTGQYARFVQQDEGSGLYSIENKIYQSSANGQFHIGLNLNIKNCQGNIIYSKQLSADQSSRSAAIERIKAQVFKQLRNYQQGVGAGTADVNSDQIDF